MGAGQERGSEFSLAETSHGEKSGKASSFKRGRPAGRCHGGAVGPGGARENREGTGAVRGEPGRKEGKLKGYLGGLGKKQGKPRGEWSGTGNDLGEPGGAQGEPGP